MTLSILQSLAVVMIALSAANERLVEIIKSMFPNQLGAPPATTPPVPVDPRQEARRQRRVQFVLLVCAWVVSAFVLFSQAGAKHPFYECFWAPFPITSGSDAFTVPTFVLALLTSGGAAFWNSVLDFTKAAKQIKEERLSTMRMSNLRMSAAPMNPTKPG
jgi:hypothetical protein